MSTSNAVGSERVAKVVGYELLKGDFSEVSPNLPQSIAIFGQANTDKQLGLSNAPVQVTSEAQAADLYGYGSQIHIAMRIIRSQNADFVGGIPTFVYPQLEPSGGAAQVDDLTVTGTATAAAVHKVLINGRSNFDGASLEISISKDDTATDIATKIADAINAAQAAPVSASAAAAVVTITTKWKGESAAEQSIEVMPVDDNDAGVSYAVVEDTAAAGDSSAEILSSLELFGDKWHTIVVNPYPKSRHSIYEDFNGVAGATPASGRYGATVWKPFLCLSGDRSSTVANITASLDNDENTIVQCPAPNSNGWNVEVAANVASLLARQAQDNPHLDVSGMTYPDMPTPIDGLIGDYLDYNNRDLLVKAGASTVTLTGSSYKVEDLITTYNPVSESVPQFRYVRSLIQDFNVRYAYFLLEQTYVVDKAIMTNDQAVSVSGTIKPKQWQGILGGMFTDLASRGIIIEVDFSNNSLRVSTSDVNPDRFETFFRYKRSAFARIASTSAEAGFGFGIE